MFTGPHLSQTGKIPGRWSSLTATIGPVLLLLVFLGLAVKWWTAPQVSERPVRSWEPALVQAKLWKEKGDLYRASSYYARAAEIAASADDWEGLLAVACGLQRLEDSLEAAMNSHTILMRAMLAAERKQSTEGLQTVAMAFKVTGEWFASFALSRIQEGRRNGRQIAKYLKSETCWPTAEKSERDP